MSFKKNINSAYIRAANRLNGKHARRKVVAYVESFDDVLFWSNLLRPLENDHVYFEVMLPSRQSLCKGKKIALANRLGPYMIACVDADYDYLMQGTTPTSEMVCRSPYVFHTYVYAIENYQCYAPTLQQVCVMTTLNDHRIFDFEAYLRTFSEIVWPLFVWNVWAYRHGRHAQFSMLDFYHIVAVEKPDLYHPERTLEALRHRVNAKVSRLQHQFPQARSTYKPLAAELQQLGVTPETTYLYMRGHDLEGGVAGPILELVCEQLRREREREIHRLAEHSLQMQNELASYQHSSASISDMLRKHTAYAAAPLYRRIQDDVRAFLEEHAAASTPPEAGTDAPCPAIPPEGAAKC